MRINDLKFIFKNSIFKGKINSSKSTEEFVFLFIFEKNSFQLIRLLIKKSCYLTLFNNSKVQQQGISDAWWRMAMMMMMMMTLNYFALNNIHNRFLLFPIHMWTKKSWIFNFTRLFCTFLCFLVYGLICICMMQHTYQICRRRRKKYLNWKIFIQNFQYGTSPARTKAAAEALHKQLQQNNFQWKRYKSACIRKKRKPTAR